MHLRISGLLRTDGNRKRGRQGKPPTWKRREVGRGNRRWESKERGCRSEQFDTAKDLIRRNNKEVNNKARLQADNLASKTWPAQRMIGPDRHTSTSRGSSS